jgi:hypothetical protein
MPTASWCGWRELSRLTLARIPGTTQYQAPPNAAVCAITPTNRISTALCHVPGPLLHGWMEAYSPEHHRPQYHNPPTPPYPC